MATDLSSESPFSSGTKKSSLLQVGSAKVGNAQTPLAPCAQTPRKNGSGTPTKPKRISISRLTSFSACLCMSPTPVTDHPRTPEPRAPVRTRQEPGSPLSRQQDAVFIDNQCYDSSSSTTFIAPMRTSLTREEAEHVSRTLVHLGKNFLNLDRPAAERDSGITKIKQLGAGGYGVVWLCKRQGKGKRVPEMFAMKEMMVKDLFRPNMDDLPDFINEHLPVREAAIQYFLHHGNIVRTYWADVRVLDARTKEPLDVEMNDLSLWAQPGQGTPKGTPTAGEGDVDSKIRALEREYSDLWRQRRSQGKLPSSVYLQLRIAMEYCTLGSLKTYLSNPREPQQETLEVLCFALTQRLLPHESYVYATALDIATALKLMHDNRILHGDLKPDNVLLAKCTTDGNLRGFVAKLGDFGIAEHMKHGAQNVPIKEGTIPYLPREAIDKLAATTKSDVYALGLIFWELWTGICWSRVYYAEMDSRRRSRNRADRDKATVSGMHNYVPHCGNDCPGTFADMVHSMISSNPKRRPEVAEICRTLKTLTEGHMSQTAQLHKLKATHSM